MVPEQNCAPDSPFRFKRSSSIWFQLKQNAIHNEFTEETLFTHVAMKHMSYCYFGITVKILWQNALMRLRYINNRECTYALIEYC